MTRKLTVIIALFVILGTAAAGAFYVKEKRTISMIQSFEECVNHGFPVMESYPEQCRTPDGRTFTAEIEPIIPTHELIRVFKPSFGEKVSSPLEIRGEAKGFWFFEASFPVVLTNWDGLIITSGIATAQADWMTTDFVPFTAELEFTDPTFPNASEDHFSRRGFLILHKDNPSGLSEYNDSFEVPIYFR